MKYAWYKYADGYVTIFVMCNLITILHFKLLPSAMHYRPQLSLWQLITVARYLDRTGCLATRHRLRHSEAPDRGVKGQPWYYSRQTGSGWRKRTRRPFDCPPSGPPWANPSWTPVASAHSLQPQGYPTKEKFCLWLLWRADNLAPLSCCSQLRHPHRPSVKCENMQSTRFNYSSFVEDRWKCFCKAPEISGVRRAVWKNKDRINSVFHN
jgi:hypothetical protein